MKVLTEQQMELVSGGWGFDVDIGNSKVHFAFSENYVSAVLFFNGNGVGLIFRLAKEYVSFTFGENSFTESGVFLNNGANDDKDMGSWIKFSGYKMLSWFNSTLKW